MIKNCPCCGGQFKVRVTRRLNNNNCEGYYIMCHRCGLETAIYDTIPEAITAWNRRYKDEINFATE